MEDWKLVENELDAEVDKLVRQMEKVKKYEDFQPILALAKGYELILSTAYSMEQEAEESMKELKHERNR